jgi:diguanylate cyclase (GGDEF)-like protein
LTGLLNRRAINHYGQREVEVALRSHQPLSVAFVDIDFFKKINDQYGHDIGDMVLQEVSRMLSLTCRSVDLVGRYGGEEFCMVFAGGGSESDRGADGLGERLVAAIRDHVFPGVSGVTISVGLAVLPASARSASWFDLVQIADSELYKAKNGDRNRYSIQFLAEHSAESESAVRLKTPLHLSVATPGALPMRGH